MKLNVSIRPLTVADAGEIAKIYHAITGMVAGDDIRKLIHEQAVREDPPSFVAIADEKVVGYMISLILPGSFGLTKSAWIAMLGVSPSYMGRGIGNKLATEILAYYRRAGINDVYTSVRWDSTDLLSFFKTLGFDRSNFINLHKQLLD